MSKRSVARYQHLKGLSLAKVKKRLVEMRVDAEMTRGQASKKTGVPIQTIADWENKDKPDCPLITEAEAYYVIVSGDIYDDTGEDN